MIRNRWISAAQLQVVLAAQMDAQPAPAALPATLSATLPATHPKLGELLLSHALITEGQLKQALREQYWRRNGYWVI